VNDGNSGGNYTVTPHSASGTITQAPLDIYAASDSKQYDGNTNSSQTPTVGAVQLQGSDTVTGKTQAFQSKNVLGANGSTLTVTGYTVNDGNSGGNYSVTVHTAQGTIMARPITVTAVTDNKVYDGTTGSNKKPQVTTGTIVGTDTGGFSETFDNKNVASNKTLTPAGSVTDGNSGKNYAITFATNTTGQITPAPLNVTGITANNKVWDGTTTATLNTGAASLSGVIGLDNVTLNTASATGTFSSSSVGTWPVQVGGLSLGGSDSGNYSLTMPTTNASISAWSAAGKGFYAPVGADAAHSVFTSAPGLPPTTLPAGMVWNTVKGGQTVPLKFNIFAGAIEQTAAGAFPNANLNTAFQTQKLNCVDSSSTDPVDYTTATGQTILRYDTTGMQWIQNWATPKVSSTTCYRTYVTFADGSSLEAFFQLTK
jgi:hypothetical protein